MWPTCSTPVAHDSSVESEFSLEDAINDLAVCRDVRPVDHVVASHDPAGASAYSLSERPRVELVLDLVSKDGVDRELLVVTVAAARCAPASIDVPVGV